MRKYILVMTAGTLVVLLQAFLQPKEPATKAELGRLLFFDPILSRDSTISCASCHRPDFAFADTSSVSTGVHNRKGTRNTPSAMNLVLQRSFFWDGRAATLEDQVLAPIENPVEMDLPVEEALQRLRRHKTYSYYFQKIFNSEPARHHLAAAIAAFERTLETSDAPFDNWKFTGDAALVSDAVKRGFKLFNDKGKCNKCHFGGDFTAQEFRNIGLFNGKELNDSGRAAITHSKADLGKFKTAGLRNVALTAPYMHNGQFKTLAEVIDFYNDPGKIVPDAINRDSILAQPMGLTPAEKKDLEAFLLSLTDKRFLPSKQQ